METLLSESRKQLLSKLLRGSTPAAARARGISARPPGKFEAPVSYGQQQVWLHSQFSTKVPIYNEPVTVHRYGPFDRAAFEKSFTEIVRRHEAWRTTFAWKGADLVQRIQPAPAHIDIPFLDVSGLPATQREDAALKIATADALAPFDLATGPMYRPRLIRFSDQEHRLFLALHHIIFDGVSLYRVFLPELQTLYEAYSRNQPSPLPEPELQYADYAVWHRGWVKEVAPQQLEYWRSKLDGAPTRDILKTDHPRAEVQNYRGAMETLALDAQTSEALKALSREAGVTLFMALLATFHALIWAYTREDDMVIGSTSAGRSRSETDAMLGFFLNTIVLRTDLSGDPTFFELMRRGREELLGALANDGIPFEHLVKELCPKRDGGRTPFFQVLFSFEPPLAPLDSNWRFTQMDIETGAAKFDLHLELDERHDGIIGRFIYNSDLFEVSTITRMLEVWRDIVRRAVETPQATISQLVPPFDQVRGNPVPRDVVSFAAPAAPAPQRSTGLRQAVKKLFSVRS